MRRSQTRRRFLLAPLALALLAGCLADFDDRPYADAGPTDAGQSDAGPADAGPADAGQSDAGPLCGNGTLDPGEACDQGAANSDTVPDACRMNCQPARCGDGVTDAGETCDDGPGNSDLTPDTCRTSCQQARCGDGVTDAGETCDDGNLAAGDGCSAACQVESLPVLHSYASSSTGWLQRTLTWAFDTQAPTTKVQAAAGMEPDAEALLFTTTTWHLLSLPGAAFVASGDVASTFPGLPTAALQSAVGLWDQDTSRHSVMFLTGGYAYVYSYAGTPDTGTTVEVAGEDVSTHADWQSAYAPDPLEVVADFMDMYNSHGWITATIPEVCGTGPDQQVVGYGVYLGTDYQVHLYEVGTCFEFFGTMALGSFGPFAEAGAPLAGITAMFYLEPGETLYVLTQ